MLSKNSDVKTQNINAKLKSNNVRVRAYDFSLAIIKFVNNLPNKKAFWAIGDQLLRSATSIGANLIEAQASSSRRDFIKFYQISLKSANETVYWLSLIKDSFPELKEKTLPLLQEAVEISNMLGKSIITLKDNKSFKF